jgi:hypothetical protein
MPRGGYGESRSTGAPKPPQYRLKGPRRCGGLVFAARSICTGKHDRRRMRNQGQVLIARVVAVDTPSRNPLARSVSSNRLTHSQKSSP